MVWIKKIINWPPDKRFMSTTYKYNSYVKTTIKIIYSNGIIQTSLSFNSTILNEIYLIYASVLL